MRLISLLLTFVGSVFFCFFFSVFSLHFYLNAKLYGLLDVLVLQCTLCYVVEAVYDVQLVPKPIVDIVLTFMLITFMLITFMLKSN